jgi:hypothetical protein
MATNLSNRIAHGAQGRPEPADKNPDDRPGVPMYKPAGTSSALTRPILDQQQTTVPVLVGVDIGELTPVFGTCQPPHGLSGLIRRAAYRIPEHKAGRWMLLLFGDRVDVWESRVARRPLFFGGVVAVGIGAFLQLRRVRRRSWARRLLDQAG